MLIYFSSYNLGIPFVCMKGMMQMARLHIQHYNKTDTNFK